MMLQRRGNQRRKRTHDSNFSSAGSDLAKEVFGLSCLPLGDAVGTARAGEAGLATWGGDGGGG